MNYISICHTSVSSSVQRHLSHLSSNRWNDLRSVMNHRLRSIKHFSRLFSPILSRSGLSGLSNILIWSSHKSYFFRSGLNSRHIGGMMNNLLSWSVEVPHSRLHSLLHGLHYGLVSHCSSWPFIHLNQLVPCVKGWINVCLIHNLFSRHSNRHIFSKNSISHSRL